MSAHTSVNQGYSTLPLVTGIRGFVVYIHDALNVSIDIDFPPEMIESYKDAHKTKYIRQDVSDDGKEMSEPESKALYSCHIKGVKINHDDGSSLKVKTSLRNKARSSLIRPD